jgi:hypothetical protein
MGARALTIWVLFILAGPRVTGQKFIDLGAPFLDVGDLDLIVDSVFVPFGNEACIGSISDRFDHEVVNVYFTEPIGTAIRKLCSNSIRGNANAQHIVLRLSRLRVLGPRCSIHVEMIRSGTSQNDVLFSYANSFVNGGDCSLRNQTANIARAFTEAFRAWTEHDPSHARVIYSEPADRISAMAPRPLLRNVQRPGPNVAGLYHAYSDMLNERVDTSMALKTRETTRSSEFLHELKVRGDVDQGIIRNCWGYTDGQKRYINVLGRFAELKADTSAYYTYAVPKQEPGAVGDAVMWGAMFGLAGALIATAATIPTNPIRFDLDPYSGELHPADHSGFNEPVGTEQIIHYSHFSRSDEEVSIRIEGRVVAQLHKDQYVKLKPIPCPRPIYAEVVTASGQFRSFRMDTNASFVQIHLFNVKRKGTVNVDLATGTMVPEILDRLKPGNSIQASYP